MDKGVIRSIYIAKIPLFIESLKHLLLHYLGKWTNRLPNKFPQTFFGTFQSSPWCSLKLLYIYHNDLPYIACPHYLSRCLLICKCLHCRRCRMAAPAPPNHLQHHQHHHLHLPHLNLWLVSLALYTQLNSLVGVSLFLNIYLFLWVVKKNFQRFWLHSTYVFEGSVKRQ